MQNRTELTALALLCAAALAGSACTTLYQQQTVKIPTNAKVGVIMYDPSSLAKKTGFTFDKNYVYEVMLKKKLIPVAVNDINVEQIVKQNLWFDNLQAAPVGPEVAKPSVVGSPVLLSTLQQHFKNRGLDFVLLLHVKSSALDEDLQAVLVRVEDMTVVGTKYYKYRIMAPLCIGICMVGVGIIICPLLYLKNKDKTNHDLIDDLLSEMM